MSFSDWDIYTTGSIAVFPNTSTIIEDLQAIEFDKDASSATANVNPSAASGLTKGITAGRMRTLCKRISGGSDVLVSFGIYCMASQVDLTSIGSCYALEIQGDGTLRLHKHSSGLDSAGSILATSATVIVDVTTLFAIELMWFFDTPEFSGIKLQVKLDESPVVGVTAYDNLALINDLDVTDTSTPLSISLAEGLYMSDRGAGSTHNWIADKTQLYSITFE